ncbi:MAG: 2-oxo acid dehydrogenase subunit E2 [bacterium]
MIQEFRLPDLGEGIEGGEVVQVHLKKGDSVAVDQVILELETDKATIEVPSPFGGTVKDIHVKEGQQAQVGQLILTVEARAIEKDLPKEIPLPVDDAQSRAPAMSPATKPAEAEKESLPATATATATVPPHLGLAKSPPDRPKKLAPASPTVRRFAREIGIDINQVPGTGPGGRISVEDVKRYSRDRNARRTQSTGAGLVIGQFAPPLPDFEKWGAVEREKMSNIRKSTAAAMAQAWNTIPHVTQHDKADITDLEKLRKSFAPQAEVFGTKLTVTAILIKIAASALKRFPKFNSSIDVAGNQVIFKKYFNIGVAVDTERGLLVPVVKNAEQKNILEIAAEVSTLAEKARNKKLTIDEMQGATFTITNLGGIGGTSFTPIVNWPEVAILGVSRGQKEPVLVEGEYQPRLMLPLSLSYDHRIIDGADAARFVRWICTALEQPFMIALEG